MTLPNAASYMKNHQAISCMQLFSEFSLDKVQFSAPFSVFSPLYLHLSEKPSSTFCLPDLSRANLGFYHLRVDREQQTFIDLYENVTAT